MCGLDENIEKSLASAIDEVARKHSEAFARTIQAITAINLQRGRVHWRLEQSPEHTVCAYVWQVAAQYLAQHVYIESLQVQKAAAAWEPLQQKVQGRAYRLLLRWGFPREQSYAMTADITQDACLEILFAHYPYDCNFDAWLAVLVHHVCRKHAQRIRKEQKNMAALELIESASASLAYRTQQLELEFAVTKEKVMTALQQLSQIQQDVILARYVLGKSLAEIAMELDIAANTVYKRHHDALKKLRKILEPNEH